MIGRLWISLFVIAALSATLRSVTGADPLAFTHLSQALFDSARSAFELGLGLAGNLMFWMGMMAVAEQAGVITQLGRLFAPLLRRVFPSIPADHPASGAMIVNFAANALGLDNAATPAGLKAMRALRELNPQPETASNEQIMFMVLHAASLTFLPISIIALRSAAGATHPADVFIPLLLVSCISATSGLLSVAVVQKLNLGIKGWLLVAVMFATILGIGCLFRQLPVAQLQALSGELGGILLITTILLFFAYAHRQRLDVWNTFIAGAQEGWYTTITLLPYLLGMLVAIGLLRASGVLEALAHSLQTVLSPLGFDADSAAALPVMLMKPLSGSAARGLFAEVMTKFGPDSQVAHLAALFQGGSDTTFYVLTLYAGAAGIKNLRYALPCALIADLCGWIGAAYVTHLFFA